MPDNFEDIGTSTRQPGWHKVANPGTGWFASKTASWVADRFSDTPTDCLTVNFSSVVPVGTRAVRITVYEVTVGSACFYRKGSDGSISNTPNASAEYSHIILSMGDGIQQAVVWLSATYTADFAVGDVNTDLYLSYPVEYLL